MFLKYIVSQVSTGFRLQGSDLKMILVSFGDVDVGEMIRLWDKKGGC
jgi:hypothetical protein